MVINTITQDVYKLSRNIKNSEEILRILVINYQWGLGTERKRGILWKWGSRKESERKRPGEGNKTASEERKSAQLWDGHYPQVIRDLGGGGGAHSLKWWRRCHGFHQCSYFVLILSGLSVFNKEKEHVRAGAAAGFMTVLPTFEGKSTLQSCEATCRRPRDQVMLPATHLPTCNWVCSSASASANRRQLPKSVYSLVSTKLQKQTVSHLEQSYFMGKHSLGPRHLL